MNTIYTVVSAENDLFHLSVLVSDTTLKPYKDRISLTWFKDRSQKDSLEEWDGEDWLKELFKKNERHVKEFKEYVKDNYSPEVITPKKAYKEFRKSYKLLTKIINEKVQNQ